MHTENKMGTMQMDRLLLEISTPMILSMLVQALYNIVDSYFVSEIGEDALTSVSICFPMQTLIIACSVGLGVGMNSLLSRALGEKRGEYANKISNVGIFMFFCLGLMFAFVGLFFTDAFIDSQKVTDSIKTVSKGYMKVVMTVSMPLCFSICFERLLASTGRTFYTMLTQCSGAVTNIILDPIFIFVLGQGVRGAAIATVIGQGVGMICGLMFHHLKNQELRLDFSYMRPDRKIMMEALEIGLPTIVMQSIASLTILVFNSILSGFSGTAIAFYGVYFKLQSFIILPIIGLANGLMPIVAYNYGAKNRQRIILAIKYAVIFSMSIMAFGVLLFQIFPAQILGIFHASNDMLKIGIPALRTISISYIFASVLIMMSAVYQGLGSGVPSLTVSLIRQVGFLIPTAYYFSLSGDINKVWYSFIIAELGASLVSIFITKSVFTKLDFESDF